MADHIHRIGIKAPITQVYVLLSTAEGIAGGGQRTLEASSSSVIPSPSSRWIRSFRLATKSLSKPITTPSFPVPAPLLSDHMAGLVPMSQPSL